MSLESAAYSLNRASDPASKGLFARVSQAVEAALLNWIDLNRYLPIQLDITNLCNLRCSHCYHPHHKNQGALSLNDWFGVIDQYFALIEKLRYRPYLIICGGEPLTSSFLKPVVEYTFRKNSSSRVSILTNGVLAPLMDLAFFEKHRSNLCFQVSLDGPTPETHDLVRGRGNFEKAKQGVRFLQTHGFKVHLLAVLSKNSSSQIPAFFDTAKEWKVSELGFTRLIVNGEAKKSFDRNVDRPLLPLELKQAYEVILSESLRTRISSNKVSPLMHLLHPSLGRSGRFWEGLVIDYQGYILASSRSRLRIGHIGQDRIEDVLLHHPIFKSLRKGDVKVCGSCPYFRQCGGDRNAAYADSGDYLGPDPGCWIAEVESGLDKKGA